jgi:porin
LVPFEVGWTPEFSQNGRVGYYKIDGWYSNANAGDVYLDIDRQLRAMTGVASLQRSSRSGIWINLQQQLIGRAVAGKPVSGMGVFLNLTQTDRRTSVTDNQVSAGLFWKAIIPSLPNDVLGFAVARTNVNSRAARGIAPSRRTPRFRTLNMRRRSITACIHSSGWSCVRTCSSSTTLAAIEAPRT